MAGEYPALDAIGSATILEIGGGAAGVIQAASVCLRLKSPALTGGLGNPVVAGRGGRVGVTSMIAIILPLAPVGVVVLETVLVLWLWSRVASRPPCP